MKLYNYLSLILFITISTTFAQKISENETSALVQISIFDSLAAGKYDGSYKLEDLLNDGGFGLGTFDKLDGEMIILNNSIYQFKTDGKIYNANLFSVTPFALIVKFKSDYSFDIYNADEKELKDFVNNIMTSKDLFYAIKVYGKFSYIKTRTVESQTKPYKPLSEVLKNQIEFEKVNLDGTIVGFYCPQFSEKINIPGYHFHFINDDLDFGGHVLDFKIDYGKIEIQKINQLKIIFNY